MKKTALLAVALACATPQILAASNIPSGPFVPLPNNGGVQLKYGCLALPGNQIICPDGGTFSTVNPNSVSLFVDPIGGNDGSPCTSDAGANACLTLQGAINRAAAVQTGNTTITLPVGTFDGGYIEGFTCRYTGAQGGSPTSAQSPWIWINGTQIAATITGAQTGTVTSATAGGTLAGGAPSTYGTVTKTAAGWTVNALVGLQFCITANTGAGQCRQIDSNTATVVTIVGSWTTTPDSTSTFAINDVGSLVTPTLSEESGPISGIIGVAPVFQAGNAAFIARNNNCSNSNAPSIAVTNVGVSTPTTGFNQFLRADGPGSYVLLQNDKYLQNSTSTGRVATLGHGASLYFESSYVLATGSGSLRTIANESPDTAPGLLAVGTPNGQSFVYARWNKVRGNNESSCVNAGSSFLYGASSGTSGHAIQNSLTGLGFGFGMTVNNVWSLGGNHWLASPAGSCSAGYVYATRQGNDWSGNNFVTIDGDTIDGNSGGAIAAFYCRGGMIVVLGAYTGDASTIQNSQFTYYMAPESSAPCVFTHGTYGNGANPVTSTNVDINFVLAGGSSMTFPLSAVPVQASTGCTDCCIEEMATHNKVCNQ